MLEHTEYTGSFEAADLFNAACALAGCLAESGCHELSLSVNGGPPRPLAVRETDLPGELVRLFGAGNTDDGMSVILRDAEGVLHVELRRSGKTLEWRTTSRAVGDVLD